MTIEHKLISLAEFKAKTEGPGGFEGYISRWGELDDGGDIVAKGAHVDAIPDFLEHGFITNNHDWAFASLLGYPTSAYEDEEGTWVSMEFHSTEDAQTARVKALERRKAGRSVRLSMGYQPQDVLWIEPADYATEIPKYSKPAFVAANIQKAGTFPQVRILLKEQLFEGALVSVPMLASAAVTAVKSSDSDGLHAGMTLEEQGRQALALVTSYNDRLKAIVRLAIETKVGAAISQARRERISTWGQTLRQLADEVDELYEETAPKPKQEDDEGKQALIADVLLAIARRDSARRGVPIR